MVEFTIPTFTLQSLVGTALPLYVVTMASQNVPGVTVLKSLGHDVPSRASMSVTGLGTMLVAPFGGHVINLAALSAVLGPVAMRAPIAPAGVTRVSALGSSIS